MPRYDFPSSDVEEIPFKTNPDCKLRLRRAATYGDAGAAVRRTHELMPDREANLGLWVELRMFMNVLVLAEGWNLEDDEGNPVPLTLEALKGLHPKDGDALLEAANRAMEGRPVAAEIPFANGSSKPSAATKSSRHRSSRN